MAISTEIVGKTFGPFVRLHFKDLEICALGCGAGWDGPRGPGVRQRKATPRTRPEGSAHFRRAADRQRGDDHHPRLRLRSPGSLHYGIDVHFHAPFKMNDHRDVRDPGGHLGPRRGSWSLSKQVGKSYSADGTHLCTVTTYDCCIA